MAEHRPKRLVIPHAGIPPGVQAALEEAGCGDVPVYNLHHNNRATGELGLALLLALSRKTMVADRLCRRGDWGAIQYKYILARKLARKLARDAKLKRTYV